MGHSRVPIQQSFPPPVVESYPARNSDHDKNREAEAGLGPVGRLGKLTLYQDRSKRFLGTTAEGQRVWLNVKARQIP